MPIQTDSQVQPRSDSIFSSISGQGKSGGNKERFHSWNQHQWHNQEDNNEEEEEEVTVTSLATAVGAFTTTVITKSFTLASTSARYAGPGLLCLPAGYTVC